MDILSPDFARYRKTKVVMYRYEVKIEIWDLETFKIILHDRVTVDENEIEGIDTFTRDEEFINQGGKLQYKKGKMEISKPTYSLD